MGLGPLIEFQGSLEEDLCPRCSGARYVLFRHRDHPAVPMPCPECNAGATPKTPFKREGVPARFTGLSPLSGLFDDPEKVEARNFAVDFARGGRGVFLYGPNGVGKTGLLTSAMLRRVQQTGESRYWFRFSDMLRAVRDGYRDETSSIKTLLLQRVRLLMLDDLGDPFSTGPESDNARSIFYDVVSYRYDMGLPMLLTSNHTTLEAFVDDFDPRTADRILDMCAHAYMGGRNLRHA